MQRNFFAVNIVLSLLAAWGIPMQSDSGLEKGKIIDRVICQNSPSQSYALYLPQEYTLEKSWPILYAFDPSARGKVPVERFKEAAEKFNYIVAGSHNSRNGPWEDIFSAMHALWDDTNSRLNIDKKSVYTTGFSGGARAAAAFSKVINHPAAGIPHRIHFFEGSHNWPPSDVCASALEWMEIMRMKQNVIPKDQNKIACSPLSAASKTSLK